ncbi:MAG: hypothetical protein KAJ55_04645 [Anaerolineales bacterium]|nr:hypothetical protein [Anaerolineales bacterium]
MTELFTEFLLHDGVGLTLGIVVASGMIIGTSMIYLGMGWRQILGWIIAFGVLMVFVETIRIEVLLDHGHPYTARPFLTIIIPFSFYVSGIVPGALMAKHYCKGEKEYLEMLQKVYDQGDA